MHFLICGGLNISCEQLILTLKRDFPHTSKSSGSVDLASVQRRVALLPTITHVGWYHTVLREPIGRRTDVVPDVCNGIWHGFTTLEAGLSENLHFGETAFQKTFTSAGSLLLVPEFSQCSWGLESSTPDLLPIQRKYKLSASGRHASGSQAVDFFCFDM